MRGQGMESYGTALRVAVSGKEEVAGGTGRRLEGRWKGSWMEHGWKRGWTDLTVDRIALGRP